MFKIVKRFLGWVLRLFDSSITQSSQAAERQTLLPRENGITDGGAQTDENSEQSIAQEHRHRDGETYGTFAESIRSNGIVRSSGSVHTQKAAQGMAQMPKATNDAHISQVQSNSQTGQADHTPQISNARMGDQAESHKEDQDLLTFLARAESSRDFGWKCVKYIFQDGKINSKSIALGLLITLVFVGLFVAWATVGVLSAGIASDGVGLSSSKSCGLWQFDDEAGDEAAYRSDLSNRRKEERASEYAQNCYNTPDAINTLSCRIFYNQSISFESKSRQRCPFLSSELCYDGLYSAATFDTGYVDASTIGINAPATHKFRRTSSCSPLNMSEPYIKKVQGTDKSSYFYNYGPTSRSNYTFDTSGDPFKWLVPIYSMK